MKTHRGTRRETRRCQVTSLVYVWKLLGAIYIYYKLDGPSCHGGQGHICLTLHIWINGSLTTSKCSLTCPHASSVHFEMLLVRMSKTSSERICVSLISLLI